MPPSPALPKLCLGTMTFGSQLSEPDAHRLLDLWADRGQTFLDTANIYNKGASEQIVGRWLKDRDRSRILLATKVRGKMGDGPLDSGLSRAAILKQIEDSLRRLRTDYVDIYYLHMPDPETPIDESLDALDELRRTGKVRFPAASNYAAWQMVDMRNIAERRNFAPITVSQPMYNVLTRAIEQEFLPMCKKFGIRTCVYNPLAGGLLTGKHHGSPESGSRFDGNQMYLDRYWKPGMFEAVEKLRATGRPLVSLALNWLIHHSQTDSIILGASKLAQLEGNLSAAEDGPLDEATLKVCEEVWNELKGEVPQYNR
jgi:aryl-alcohol dehydrogenase-like predicted oxidoreductase